MSRCNPERTTLTEQLDLMKAQVSMRQMEINTEEQEGKMLEVHEHLVETFQMKSPHDAMHRRDHFQSIIMRETHFRSKASPFWGEFGPKLE